MNTFSRYAHYYDVLYQQKDYRGEARYFLGLVRQYGRPNSRTLLEYGAGTGGHQAFFEEAGFACSGIDLSDEMCEIGRARGARLLKADIRNYRHPQQVDVVFALFHVVSYITRRRELLRVLTGARKNLLPGGVFIFDVWFQDAVLHQRPAPRVKRASRGSIEVVRIAEPLMIEAKKLVTVRYTLFGRDNSESDWRSFSESHTLRYFSVADLELLANSAKLELVSCRETMTSLGPNKDNYGLTVILKR